MNTNYPFPLSIVGTSVSKILLLLTLLNTLLFSQETFTRTQAIMGTFVHITLPKKHNKTISTSFTQIKELEASLSSYKPHLVYQLNQMHTIPYNPTLAHAITLSKQLYKETYGYFDISIGSISKSLYHFGEENSTILTQKALQNAKRNIEGIFIHEHNISTAQGIVLDLGGMGKGYGVDRVVERLSEQNISQGIVALSGDIRCLDVCTFELQSPYSEQTFATLTAKIPQLSISTSGTYRRYVKDQTHHHLIDPKTAKQGKAFVSVSLFCHADNAKIDAYATAISVMPLKVALAFLKEHDEVGFVLVKSDGKIVYGNLEKFVSFSWINYKEKATIPSNTKNSNTNTPKSKSFTHPDTTNPKMIGR